MDANLANGNSVMWRQRGEARWLHFLQNNEVLPGCPLSAWTTPCWTTGGRSASQGRTAPSRWSRASSRWTEPARARWRWGQSTFVVRTAFYSIIVEFYQIFLYTYSCRLEYLPLWYKLLIQITWATNCILSELCPMGLLGQRWLLHRWFPPGEQMQ